jgi:hypothetical protein
VARRSFPPQGPAVWTRLQSLTLGPLRPRENTWLVEDLPGLTVLDISRKSGFNFTTWDPVDATEVVRQAPRLEYFRYGGATSDEVLLFIEPALRSGTLKAVDLQMPSRGSISVHRSDGGKGQGETTRPTNDAFESIDGLDWWFNDKQSITTLGLSNFHFPSVSSYSSYTGVPFASWVKRFPNVHTVHAYPEKFDGCQDTIRALLLEAPQVKTIYQDCLLGVGRDQVLQLASQKGVRIVHSRDRAPGPWPTSQGEHYV